MNNTLLKKCAYNLATQIDKNIIPNKKIIRDCPQYLKNEINTQRIQHRKNQGQQINKENYEALKYLYPEGIPTHYKMIFHAYHCSFCQCSILAEENIFYSDHGYCLRCYNLHHELIHEKNKCQYSQRSCLNCEKTIRSEIYSVVPKRHRWMFNYIDIGKIAFIESDDLTLLNCLCHSCAFKIKNKLKEEY